MVPPDLMESEDNLNEYVRLRNIEGKVLIKKTLEHDDCEEDESGSVDEIPRPITNIADEEKLEFGNSENVTASPEQESPADNDNNSDLKTTESDKETEQKRKGILKYERTYSNKHVDFNMDLEFVPFDESKDYTIEIQIVEQMPKKIVSYAALFAQQKKEEEDKLKKEAEEKEKQNRKHNKKRKYQEWKKNRKLEKQKNTPDQEIEQNSSSLKENDVYENLLSTEDEIDDLSENSYHSDTDKEEHSDATTSNESEGILHVEDNTRDQTEEREHKCAKPSADLNNPLSDTVTGMDIKLAHKNDTTKNQQQHSCTVQDIEDICESNSISLNNAVTTAGEGIMNVEDEIFTKQTVKQELELPKSNDDLNVHLRDSWTVTDTQQSYLNEPMDNQHQNSSTAQEIEDKCESNLMNQNNTVINTGVMDVEDNDIPNQTIIKELELPKSADYLKVPMKDAGSVAGNKQIYDNEAKKNQCQYVTIDQESKCGSNLASQNNIVTTHSEGVMTMEDSSKNHTEKQELKLPKPTGDLRIPLNETVTGRNIKPINHEEATECQKVRMDQGTEDKCEII